MLALRFEEGNRFEACIADELRGLAGDDWVFVDEGSSRAVEETVEAMSAGAAVIVGSNLPTDQACKRSGKPDLLVRHGGGYVPVDVKHHRTLEEDAEGQVHTSPLAAPSPDEASARAGLALYRRKEDALQLAHYHRMLESSGHASDAAIGGIIGTEREVTWYQLDVPMWQTPAKSGGKKVKRRTTLENYDFEFGFRLDVAAVAHEHRGDPTRVLLVLPVHCGECAECLWPDPP